jgi:hypothetical protein
LRRGFDWGRANKYGLTPRRLPGLKEVPEISRVELVNPMRREVLDQEVSWIAGDTSLLKYYLRCF